MSNCPISLGPIEHASTEELVEQTLLMMRVLENTIPDCDCLLWTGATSTSGYPIIKVGSHGCQLVRRVVAQLAGNELAPRQPVVATCGRRLCVHPEHLVPSTIAAVAQSAALRGSYGSLQRCRAIAESKRGDKGAKLTMEIVLAIRASTESGPELARRYGVTRSHITAIRRGTAWPDYDTESAFAMHQLHRLRQRIGREVTRISREAEQRDGA